MSITPVRIAGEQRTTAAVVEITNPYRGRVIAEMPLCGPGEVDVACHAKLRTKEVPGPVVITIRYEDSDEAMAIANDTDFGLHAGVFTNEVSTALRAVRGLDFGGVLINEVPTFRADQQPYGGLRDSGNTREGPAYVVEEMTELRFVSMNA